MASQNNSANLNTDQLYNVFISSYVKAHPDIKREESFRRGNLLWKELRQKKYMTQDDRSKIKNKIIELKVRISQRELKQNAFWSNILTIQKPNVERSKEDQEIQQINRIEIEKSQEKPVERSSKRRYHAEDQINKDIIEIKNKIIALKNGLTTGLLPDDKRKEFKQLEEPLKKFESRKNYLINNRETSRRNYSEKKQMINKIKDTNLQLLNECDRLLNDVGRPRIENEELLLKTIIDIASIGGAADERRRSEMIKTCKTLDQLTGQLQAKGFNISRSATYLRLSPRRSLSNEGKRHVKTVPVRIIKAQNTLRKYHDDWLFAKATIEFVKKVITLSGPINCFFISRDDKAKISLGLPAANKQSSMLMHLDYQVKLPDQDFVIAPRHKLVPSMYGACKIDDQIKYTGLTYVTIRLLKHNKINAGVHASDFEDLLLLDPFIDMICDPTGQLKPIGAFSVDGGPDQNPRFPATVNAAVHHFKKHNLDALFIMIRA